MTVAMTDSRKLLAAIVDAGLTVTAAGRRARISKDTFRRLIRSDSRVTAKVAGKLTRTFGADVVKIVAAAESQ